MIAQTPQNMAIDQGEEDVTVFPISAKEEYRSLEKKKEELSKNLETLKTKKGD